MVLLKVIVLYAKSNCIVCDKNKEGIGQESIQSSPTSDPETLHGK